MDFSNPTLFLPFVPSLELHGIGIKHAVLLTMIMTTNLALNFSSLAPREIIEMPKGVYREDKIPNGKGEEVNDHPTEIHDLARGDEDKESRETENRRKH